MGVTIRTVKGRAILTTSSLIYLLKNRRLYVPNRSSNAIMQIISTIYKEKH